MSHLHSKIISTTQKQTHFLVGNRMFSVQPAVQKMGKLDKREIWISFNLKLQVPENKS